jgi:hypothetical protein
MSEIKKFSLVKPTVQVPFHIDFEWWRTHDENWHVALVSMLCPEHQAVFSNLSENLLIDWVDPETAEIRQMDGLQHILIQHCAKQAGFLDEHTVMVEAVFRLLLSNGNTPMSPAELSARLNRPAETILKTIAGPRVYKGLRPYMA